MWAKLYCECKNEIIEHINVTKVSTQEEGYRCTTCSEFKPLELNEKERL